MPAKFTDPLKEAERRISEWIRFRFDFAPIDFSGLGLSSLPARLFTLKPLRSLNLARNKFIELPEELGTLENLNSLDVRKTQLESLPDSLAGLRLFHSLQAENNRLRSLPTPFFMPGAMPALESLYLRGNPALGIPDSVLGPTWIEAVTNRDNSASPASILNYYFEHRLMTPTPPNEGETFTRSSV